MTTTITPALGAGILMTQQGQGTTPGYSAIDERRMTGPAAVQEGVFGATDFMVVERALGQNMSVDIGMPSGGQAAVLGDAVAGQGMYTVPVNSTLINEAIAANSSGNPRIDTIILETLDNVHDGGGNNIARTRVLTGTPSPAATLNSRSGAVSLPGSALILADILVANGAAVITNSVIRDRRKWARGAYRLVSRTSGSYTTTSTTTVAIDTATLGCRLECSGAPLRVVLASNAQHSVADTAVTFTLMMDGSAVASRQHNSTPAGAGLVHCFEYEFTPSAGSHLFDMNWNGGAAGTSTLFATASVPLSLSFEEITRPSAANNTTTSG